MNEQPRSAPGEVPGAVSASLERRRRLQGIRAEVGPEEPAGEPASAGSAAAAALAPEGGEHNEFIKDIVERRRQRKHQLEIIQDFFQNPVEFGVDMDALPSGTTLEEIQSRKKELGYRIDLLKSVLSALEGELEMFKHAERSTRATEGNGAASGNGSATGDHGGAPAPPPQEKR